MGLASTFTNSIVREIGRNYGKSISNDLLGDSHSTPVRMVGGSSSQSIISMLLVAIIPFVKASFIHF